jgi:O-succinylbenzoate synthase
MKIYRSLYEHEPLAGEKIQGCLMKVHFAIGLEGYADLHPWVRYGDAPLGEQFELFASGAPSRIFLKTLFFAGEDAQARQRARSLLQGLDIPLSHALVRNAAETEIAYHQGFRHFKSKDPNMDIPVFPDAHWRLDLGGRWTFAQFQLWWEGLTAKQLTQIEMIEDPWRGKGTLEDNRFYSDWVDGWQGKVFKPARDESFLLQHEFNFKRVMFTHSLDHPIGQAAAMWEAAKFYQKYPQLRQVCGFSKTRGFESWDWESVGPRRKPPSGLGFGFDDQLKSLRWERFI